MDDKEIQALREAADKARADLDSLKKETEGIRIVSEAKDEVHRLLREAELPEAAKERLRPVLASNPPVKEGALDKAALSARVSESVKAEQEYMGPVALPLPAAALLVAGAVNVVVGGRPPGPLDILLDGWFVRELPVASAFHQATANGAVFLYGVPE